MKGSEGEKEGLNEGTRGKNGGKVTNRIEVK